MGLAAAIAILLVFLTCLWYVIIAISSKSEHRKLPPGPRPLPIIGNLHMLGHLPHRSLQHLAKKYGPIMFLRLGSVPTIIVSSPKAAELFLKTHDTNFASRPVTQFTDYMSYGSKGLVFAQYGPYWRHVRKLCTLQLLCPAKIETFAPLRREELGLLVRKLKKAAEEGEVVDLSEKIGELNEEITYKMVLGCSRLDNFDLKAIVHELVCLAGAFNVSDFIPSITALDIQGMTKRTKECSRRADQLLEKIIDNHEQQPAKGKNEKNNQNEDFVDLLLSLMNQPLNPNDEQVIVLDRTNVKAILLDMIAAAFDTSATSIVWTISELLKHPRVMKNLQEELQSVIGNDRMVEESDLQKLGYLSMVVKESFRLHPVAPILIHYSLDDIKIDEYDIPKNSRILINLWSMGRDPEVWSGNVDEFFPERFMNNSVDLRGRDFQLLPFGSGRRGCPGLHLGLTTVRLTVAQMVHCFNWELPTGLFPQNLDMTEKFGITVSKANHLLAKPTYRLM